ncbi:unnamed protein product [Somion occarium]|uniref:Uncharacterized protein n=1 Tax=Somion occarium TaxID=3059160 RepID=A0ABP1DUD0_9APHY
MVALLEPSIHEVEFWSSSCSAENNKSRYRDRRNKGPKVIQLRRHMLLSNGVADPGTRTVWFDAGNLVVGHVGQVAQFDQEPIYSIVLILAFVKRHLPGPPGRPDVAQEDRFLDLCSMYSSSCVRKRGRGAKCFSLQTDLLWAVAILSVKSDDGISGEVEVRRTHYS